MENEFRFRSEETSLGSYFQSQIKEIDPPTFWFSTAIMALTPACHIRFQIKHAQYQLLHKTTCFYFICATEQKFN